MTEDMTIIKPSEHLSTRALLILAFLGVSKVPHLSTGKKEKGGKGEMKFGRAEHLYRCIFASFR